jgi:hypothetical protein
LLSRFSQDPSDVLQKILRRFVENPWVRYSLKKGPRYLENPWMEKRFFKGLWRNLKRIRYWRGLFQDPSRDL